jgi:hypothetical protein
VRAWGGGGGSIGGTEAEVAEEGDEEHEYEAPGERAVQIDGFWGEQGAKLVFTRPVVVCRSGAKGTSTDGSGGGGGGGGPLGWHAEIAAAMRLTMAWHLDECVVDLGAFCGPEPLPTGGAAYRHLLSIWPSQVLVIAHEVWFARQVETAMAADGGAGADAESETNPGSATTRGKRGAAEEGNIPVSSRGKEQLAALAAGKVVCMAELVQLLRSPDVDNTFRTVASNVYVVLLLHRDRLVQLSAVAKLAPLSFAWQRHARYSMVARADGDVATVDGADDRLSRSLSPSPSPSESGSDSSTYLGGDRQPLQCFVAIPGGAFEYTHEFDGRASAGLQINPVTDRYLLNINLAMHAACMPMLKGGGSAHTVVTARHAASALGRFLVEVECSPELTTRPLTRLLCGAMRCVPDQRAFRRFGDDRRGATFCFVCKRPAWGFPLWLDGRVGGWLVGWVVGWVVGGLHLWLVVGPKLAVASRFC